jgi:hypothetical protein
MGLRRKGNPEEGYALILSVIISGMEMEGAMRNGYPKSDLG